MVKPIPLVLLFEFRPRLDRIPEAAYCLQTEFTDLPNDLRWKGSIVRGLISIGCEHHLLGLDCPNPPPPPELYLIDPRKPLGTPLITLPYLDAQ